MSISFERIAGEYDQTRGGEERGERIGELLDPHFSARDRILEIGVGTGVVALPLRRGGREVVGVDLAPAMLRRARERIGSRVVVGDACRLPFQDGSFADVYAVWLLHLVADQAALFREAARVLRPGGRLLVVVGRPEADEVGRILVDLADRFDPGRSARDDPERLRGAAEGAGLRALPSPPPVARSFLESPADAAGRVEQRSSSAFWNVDEDEWRAVVPPALERLRAMGSDPVDRTSFEQLLIFEAP
jgi:SAM-dependent methyltransferase